MASLEQVPQLLISLQSEGALGAESDSIQFPTAALLITPRSLESNLDGASSAQLLLDSLKLLPRAAGSDASPAQSKPLEGNVLLHQSIGSSTSLLSGASNQLRELLMDADGAHLETRLTSSAFHEPSSSQKYSLIVDVEFFDSLASRDYRRFCVGVLESLQPHGLFVCVSHEAPAYGSLKRTMHSLRPSVNDRLAAKAMDDEFTLHVYARQADEKECFIVAPPSVRSSQNTNLAPDWAMPWDRTWVEPARPNINPAKILETAARFATDVESKCSHVATQPPDWLSDSVDLTLLPGRGRGLVACRAIEAGELLMISRPLFMASAEHIQTVAVSWVLEATPRQKQQFYSLFDGTNGESLPPLELFLSQFNDEPLQNWMDPQTLQPERIYKILELNAFKVDKLLEDFKSESCDKKQPIDSDAHITEGRQVTGLWAIPSLMNHSCIPSTICIPLSESTLAFVAAYDMPLGAEITNRYVALNVPRPTRRDNLHTLKYFWCQCIRCQTEHAMIDDGLSSRVAYMQEQISTLNLSPDDFLSALRKIGHTARRELHRAADAWLEANCSKNESIVAAAHSFAKSGFTALFFALALGLSQLPIEAGKTSTPEQCLEARDVWKEMCNIFEQFEPCSPNHISAAASLVRAIGKGVGITLLQQSEWRDAYLYLFAVWLGRHGVVKHVAAKAYGNCAKRLSDLGKYERKVVLREFMKAFDDFELSEVEAQRLECDDSWASALDSLRCNCVFTRSCCMTSPPRENLQHVRAVCSDTAKEQSSSEECSSQVAPAVADTSTANLHLQQSKLLRHEWEKRGPTSWRLRVYGYTSADDAEVDVSETAIVFGFRGSSQYPSLRVDVLGELGALAQVDHVKAQYVKAHGGSQAHLRIDLSLKSTVT